MSNTQTISRDIIFLQVVDAMGQLDNTDMLGEFFDTLVNLLHAGEDTRWEGIDHVFPYEWNRLQAFSETRYYCRAEEALVEMGVLEETHNDSIIDRISTVLDCVGSMVFESVIKRNSNEEE